MKNKLKRFLKSNNLFYKFYAYSGSLLVNFFKNFIPVDEKLVMFVSYGGKRYDDSPKAIFEYMVNKGISEDFKCIWAFVNPGDFNIGGAEKVKIDTFKYFLALLRAKYWITNSSVKRGLSFSKCNVVYVNTWHGTPIKKIGNDVEKNNSIFRSIGMNSDINIMFVQSKYEAKIFSKAFAINEEKLFLSGLPRNDELIRVTEEKQLAIREKLGIDSEKTVILYAPTFREYDKDKEFNCFIAPPINFRKWKDKLGERYIVMLRAHYEVGKIILNSDTKNFVVDVSNYQNVNELMIASDILISDYSSIFFDYSLLKRPMLCFAYDIDIYLKERGLYLDLDEEIPGGILKTEDEIINAIQRLDYGLATEETKKFRDKYIDKYGDASREAVKKIFGV